MPKQGLRFAAKPSDLGELAGIPEELVRQEFARRLQSRMGEMSMSQSDLVRKAFGTMTDPRGYEIPEGKNSASSYLAGKRFPRPAILRKLCEALDIEESQILPLSPVMHGSAEKAAASESFSSKQMAGHEGHAWVRVNRLLPMDLALKLGDLIAVADSRAVLSQSSDRKD